MPGEIIPECRATSVGISNLFDNSGQKIDLQAGPAHGLDWLGPIRLEKPLPGEGERL